MPLVKVARIHDLPPESALECIVGERVFAICHSEGTITAMDGLCLHAGGPLGHGQVVKGHVCCPWHLWEFNCRTGELDINPAHRQTTYPVRIVGDDILIEIQEPGA